MFRSLLIANRGEIARRVASTARAMGIRVIAVYSSADADALHVREADCAVSIGGAEPKDSYLDIEAILSAARASAAEAIHPGYGFLAENDRFAAAVSAAGLTWVGPPPAAMRAMANKAAAKKFARDAGVPVLAGYDGEDQSAGTLRSRAIDLGFPLMIKAAAGGGGRGMRLVRDADVLDRAIQSARNEALTAFSDDTLILERALERARHIEVQVFADAHGHCIHLGERDCSLQRRHQKLIEEAPAPHLDPAIRAALCENAVTLARAIGYVGAGTVEFLVADDGTIAFIEMNTRLQVEHPVTELVTGLDLVAWQLRVAAGERLPRSQDEINFSGHAIEARICAEDPARDFMPQGGRIEYCRAPRDATEFFTASPGSSDGLRIDSAADRGGMISPHYDSMIAKLIAHAPTRDLARRRLADALDETIVFGVPSNQAFLSTRLRDAQFAATGPRIDDLANWRWTPPTPDARIAALAAVLFCVDETRRATFNEWAMWSNNPAHAAFFALRIGDRRFDATVRRSRKTASEHYDVSVSGEQLPVAVHHVDGDGRATVSIGSAVHTRITSLREGTRLHLALGADTWRIDNLATVPAARGQAGATGDRILAPMNGRVEALHVATGMQVRAGVALLTLTAMKMEHVLSAPGSARIKSIHVAVGAQVRPGQLLIELDPG